MANDINVCVFTGNVTAEPKVNTSGKSTRLTFSIAVNVKDKPTFMNCVMFGKYAEAMAKYLRKGGKVAVTGTLEQYQKFYNLVVSNVNLIGAPKKTETTEDEDF